MADGELPQTRSLASASHGDWTSAAALTQLITYAQHAQARHIRYTQNNGHAGVCSLSPASHDVPVRLRVSRWDLVQFPTLFSDFKVTAVFWAHKSTSVSST